MQLRLAVGLVVLLCAGVMAEGAYKKALYLPWRQGDQRPILNFTPGSKL
jgi:hypothetical protein